ncbi:GntR family transcriptional regulator [Rhodovibrio salinarum]|uniref:GntR family transcriptional regulator n=1 Tax=Rhodovibrio salinarum TaxID=1087 RepID=UPI0006859379|nr:GntR family transcriptional regulator [Rhodovibrio salinarum]
MQDKPATAPRGRKPRLADRLRCQLEEEIATGQLAGGTRLDEAGLAKRFGVSRTPVREALSSLASAGLVETRPRQGAVVAGLSLSDLIQMFEVMAELEALCTRLAARRMTEAERTQLEQTLQACIDAADPARPNDYYDANLAFHEAIYAGSHNAYLAEQTRQLRNRLQPYRRTQLAGLGRIETSCREHAEIVDAIRQADAISAEGAMRRHVTIQADTFAELAAHSPEQRTAVDSA